MAFALRPIPSKILFGALCLTFFNVFLVVDCQASGKQNVNLAGCFTCQAIIKNLLRGVFDGDFSDLDVKRGGAKETTSYVKRMESPSFEFVNAIYTDKSISVKQEFKDKYEKYFSTSVRTADISKKEDFVKAINGLVSEKTKNSVTQVIKSDDLNSASKLVLLNVLHFKGSWKNPWTSVGEGKFKVNDTKEMNAKYMSFTATIPYLENKSIKVVKIPFVDKNVTLMVTMRNTDTVKPSTTLQGADSFDWVQQPVTVKLPIFKFEHIADDWFENQIMKKIPNITNPAVANFKAFTDMPLSVSVLYQRSFINVNEEGVEFASADGPSLNAFSVSPLTAKSSESKPLPQSGENVKQFIADHPFEFELEFDVRGERIRNIFAGRVREPTII